MKKGDLKTKSGFTMVEVMLVLGIAGLIFLMIFITIPTLSRQARDTQRKDDVNIVVSALKKYQSNNRGALPTMKAGGSGWRSVRCSDDLNGDAWDDFYCDYLGENFTDPNGVRYWLQMGKCTASADGQDCYIGSHSYNNAGPGTVDDPTTTTTFPNGFTITVVMGARCGENGKAVGSSNIRKAAVVYKLEGGGTYCENT